MIDNNFNETITHPLFYYFANMDKRGGYKENLNFYLQNVGFQNNFSKFYNLAINKYKWENLPKGITSKNLEKSVKSTFNFVKSSMNLSLF